MQRKVSDWSLRRKTGEEVIVNRVLNDGEGEGGDGVKKIGGKSEGRFVRVR